MLLRYRETLDQSKQGEEEGWQLNPRSAIFVANKWDMVPKSERDEITKDVYSQLQKIWGGLNESQVFFLSAREVSTKSLVV